MIIHNIPCVPVEWYIVIHAPVFIINVLLLLFIYVLPLIEYPITRDELTCTVVVQEVKTCHTTIVIDVCTEVTAELDGWIVVFVFGICLDYFILFIFIMTLSECIFV
jgi:hypothetical protein